MFVGTSNANGAIRVYPRHPRLRSCRSGFVVLVLSFGFVVRVCRSGLSFWFVVLVCRSGLSFWFVVLVCRSGLSFWFVVLVCRSGFGNSGFATQLQPKWNPSEFRIRVITNLDSVN